MIKEIEKEEKLVFEKDVCPECFNKMPKIGRVYKCSRCGIMVEI